MSQGDPPRGRRLSTLARIGVLELKGVGPKRAGALEAMGIETVLDLLTHYPRRYADRTNCVEVADLVVSEESVVSGVVAKVATRRLANRRSLVEVLVDDDSGRLGLTFFNQPWRARQLREGMHVVVFGKPERYRDRLQMTNPVVDLVGDQTGRVVPIYPQSDKAGVTSPELSGYVAEALTRAGEFADPLPEGHRRRLALIGRSPAFHSIHAPGRLADVGPARRRLAFDELFRLQVSLVMRKRALAKSARGIAHAVRPAPGRPELVAAFLEGLPFEVTAAQRRAVAEVAADLARPEPMHRLLQGDVGSGKTVVALAALLYGVQGGYQGAFMVPTEVLAEQHFFSARALLAGLEVPDPGRLGSVRPLSVGLLTSRTTAAERTRLHRELRQGELDLLLGTHALITDDVTFSALGVVVIDEQHRFGVDQRAALRDKGGTAEDGRDPDLLVMTATPIPRTAAMTVYGDLDLSVLDELPPGRSRVRTIWADDEAGVEAAWEKVRAEVRAGRQAYVVCPLVRPGSGDEEETADGPSEGRLFPEPADARRPARSASEEVVRLAAGPLSGIPIGLLHGQLPSREKEEVMGAFRRGELKVLVATTVIEVGVDVASATVMVVEDADRFGIAQLHQLRGRVGRGAGRSFCYLLAEEVGEEAEARLSALVRSTDGFELAEIDLELRGEGTVLGARQKGRSDLKLASLRRDRDLVEAARATAEALLDEDPGLARHELLADELELFVGEEEAEYLQRS